MRFRDPIALAGLCRTPIGKLGGVLAAAEPYKLQSAALRAARERAGMPADVLPGEVIAGNLRNSIGNIARVAALDAGIPESVPAITVDRQCASSMEALVLAAAKISSGFYETAVVGGVESGSQAPWLYARTARPYAYAPPEPFVIRMATPEVGDPPMGETAEILADEFTIAREEMDAFACDSHRKAARADFSAEIVAFPNPNPKAAAKQIVTDECIRPDTTPEVLARLRPAFRKDGRVTAGNSSPINDAAVGCYAFSGAEADRLGIDLSAPGSAWLTGAVTVALAPSHMGLGPALAIPVLLREHGLTIDDIDLFEINEAFAAQILACLKKLASEGWAIPAEKLNVHGGAIALGHPTGATGLRLVVTLVNALRQRGLRRGVASLCVGGGQGMAVLVETKN
ncbi:MAG: acetyl-CoA C-acetyltransferase [Candidatus Sumerlaeota bacterium]|nr:acetyl-CoA C-acetyltransferase [Candidatus Sumerlaeota bacterium]